MFGRWKWLAALVTYLPFAMLPTAISSLSWTWRWHFVARLSSVIQSVLWAVLVAGTVWFVILLRRHPRMNPYTKTYRIWFLILGALPLGGFFILYLITAPFVFHILAQDLNAPPKKILHLDDSSA